MTVYAIEVRVKKMKTQPTGTYNEYIHLGSGVVVEESMGAISCELLQSNYSIYYTKRSIVWVIAILSVSVLIGQQVEAAMIMF